MPKPSSEPLTKVTLNLFTADVADFKRRYGFGWSEQVRLILRANCKRHKELYEIMHCVHIISEDMVDGEE